MWLLAIAKTLAEKVEAEVNKENVSIAVGVIDMHSNFVRQQRMNDTQSLGGWLRGVTASHVDQR